MVDGIREHHALSRRMAVVGLGAAGIGLVAHRWGALAQDETTAVASPSGPLMGETYVGDVTALEAFVAIVMVAADEDQPRARAYLCGQQSSAWFNQGSASADRLQLTSEDGAELAAELSATGVSGTVKLPGGEPVSFAAAPAEGIAGLYDVSAPADGLLRGISAEGGQLRAVMAPAPLEEPEELRGYYAIIGFVTPAGGSSQPVAAAAPSAEPTDARWIVLPDGRVRGGPKKGGRDVSNTVEPIDFVRSDGHGLIDTSTGE
jgi:hypothetical protein